METVYKAAVTSAVMQPDDIKVRALPYTHFRLAHQQQQFVHVTCRLLAGRSNDQKETLAKSVRQHLAELLPEVYSLSVEIVDMHPDSYKKRLREVK